jgi:hypothetical protein
VFQVGQGVIREIDIRCRTCPEKSGFRCKLNLGRDQSLARPWALANLSHEVTSGIIGGEVKALAMIVAIERLIPSRIMNDLRLSSSVGTQPAGEEPGDPVTGTKTRASSPRVEAYSRPPN